MTDTLVIYPTPANISTSCEWTITTLVIYEMDWLENGVIVGISEESGSNEEIGLSRDQCGGVTVIRCVQDLRRGQNFHRLCFSMDSKSAADHGAVRRHTFHNPDIH